MDFLYLSLVIPVYNESKRIRVGLVSSLKYLNQQKFTWEIILVDDGSTDNTVQIAKKLLKNKPHKIIKLIKNSGKGAAVRTGMLAAKGKFIIFSDIDFSAPITQLPKLLKALKNHDLAIGVRRHPQSQILKHQPKNREILGQVFTKLSNYLVAPGICDVTCGFKGFTKTAVKKIFTKQKLNGWAFDAEVIYLARKKRLQIAQVPVVWKHNDATKVGVLKDGIEAFMDLLKIRFSWFKI